MSDTHVHSVLQMTEDTSVQKDQCKTIGVYQISVLKTEKFGEKYEKMMRSNDRVRNDGLITRSTNAILVM